MASKITPEFLRATIEEHLGKRKDFWHIVNGPKRETWFTAETIASLSNASPRDFSAGWRVYGEECCSQIAKILDEFSVPHSWSTGEEGGSKIPDITVLENCGNKERIVLSVIEAKLISPKSTRSDEVDEDGLCIDIDLVDDVGIQLKSLTNTNSSDGLLDQLERASRIFPNAQVFGIVFFVHRIGQCSQVKPSNFYAAMISVMRELYKSTSWEVWDDKIYATVNLQSVAPLGGMFNGTASLGIAIILRKSSEGSTLITDCPEPEVIRDEKLKWMGNE